MKTTQTETVATFFKAMSDENRLKILGLCSQREYSAGEIADVLGVSDATVSHHLGKLRGVGLLNLKQVGTSRIYWTNAAYAQHMSTYLQDLSLLYQVIEAQEKESWIDELDIPEYDRKIMHDYTEYGQLRQYPVKQKKLLVILRYLATKFAPGVKYTEKEVNAILEAFYEDYVTLRRDLIDFHFLAREGGGRMYWRVESAE